MPTRGADAPLVLQRERAAHTSSERAVHEQVPAPLSNAGWAQPRAVDEGWAQPRTAGPQVPVRRTGGWLPTIQRTRLRRGRSADGAGGASPSSAVAWISAASGCSGP